MNDIAISRRAGSCVGEATTSGEALNVQPGILIVSGSRENKKIGNYKNK